MQHVRDIQAFARRLWADERGAEGLEKLLILAALILPLLAVLIFFGEAIRDWLTDKWENVQDDAEVLEEDADF